MFNTPTVFTDPSGEVFSWASGFVGGLIGAAFGTVTYLGWLVITGQRITWGGIAGAATGGFAGGFLFGSLAGLISGDVSGLAVFGFYTGLGGLSGAAGGFTNSIVSQLIDQGQINWLTVGIDTWIGGVVGAVFGGVYGACKLPPATPTFEPIVRTGSPKPTYPVPKPPADPTKPPGPGWEWRGRGPRGSPQGSWFDPVNDQSLRPDLHHLPPIEPHWDWIDPAGQSWRIYLDGSIELKHH